MRRIIEPADKDAHRKALAELRRTHGTDDTASPERYEAFLDAYVRFGGAVEDVPDGADVLPVGAVVVPCAMASKVRAPPAIAITAVDTDHLVPDGAEYVAIDYAIKGDLSKVTGFALSVFADGGTRDIVHREEFVGRPASREGTILWDGALNRGGDGHDGVINVVHSPYTVRLTLHTGSGPKKSNTKQVAVQVAGVTIRAEHPANALTPEVASLVADLDANRPARLFLDTPVFKTSSLEMYCDAATTNLKAHYDADLKARWTVPLAGRVLLRGKANDRKHAAKALHGCRLRWECDDDATRTAGANAFLQSVVGNCPSARGTNCPAEVGGYSATQLFSQNGLPWGVTALDDRQVTTTLAPSAAQHPPDASAPNAAIDTGVCFSTGHVAGDAFSVKLVLDLGNGAVHASNALQFQNWRRLDLYLFCYGTAFVSLRNMVDAYREAGVVFRVMDRLGGNPPLELRDLKSSFDWNRPDGYAEDISTAWNAAYANAVRGHAAAFVQRAACDTLTDDGLGNFAAAEFLSYADYRASFRAGPRGTLTKASRFFKGAVDDPAVYDLLRDRYAGELCKAAAAGVAALGLVDRAMLLLRFSRTGQFFERGHGAGWPTGSYTAGYAGDVPGVSTRNRATTYVFHTDFQGETMTHEGGHALFLNHAPHAAAPHPPSADLDAHEPHADHPCMMNYDAGRAAFCALCRLKLAGWDYKRIGNDGALLANRRACTMP